MTSEKLLLMQLGFFTEKVFLGATIFYMFRLIWKLSFHQKLTYEIMLIVIFFGLYLFQNYLNKK